MASQVRIRNYLCRSVSFHQEAKKLLKTLLSTVLWLLDNFLPLNTEINLPTESIIKNILKATEEKSRIRNPEVRILIHIHITKSRIRNIITSEKIPYLVCDVATEPIVNGGKWPGKPLLATLPLTKSSVILPLLQL